MELKAIRTERNMTRETLAEAVSVSAFTIRNWEQGQREPDIAHLIALADALDCTVDALVGHQKGGEGHEGDGPGRSDF